MESPTERLLLCVDDEVNILTALTRLLRREGYKILTAAHGSEGLELLKENPIEVVISDYRMPEMTGTEFLQKVKELYPRTVRVVLSGYADAGVIVEAINRGEVFRFLPKPWDDEDLKTAIRQCFSHYDLISENMNLLKQVQDQNLKLKEFNDELELRIQQRTHSLKLAQEILWKLPAPVLGISSERTLVMLNDSAQKVFFPEYQWSLGGDIAEILPAEVIERVNQCLNRELNHTKHPSLVIDGRDFELQVTPLSDEGKIRGCILLFKEL